MHLGLIGVVSTRAELASVLDHEHSYVAQRYISHLMPEQRQQTLMPGALTVSKSHVFVRAGKP